MQPSARLTALRAQAGAGLQWKGSSPRDDALGGRRSVRGDPFRALVGACTIYCIEDLPYLAPEKTGCHAQCVGSTSMDLIKSRFHRQLPERSCTPGGGEPQDWQDRGRAEAYAHALASSRPRVPRMKTTPEWQPGQEPAERSSCGSCVSGRAWLLEGDRGCSIREKFLPKYGLRETAGQVPLHGDSLERELQQKLSFINPDAPLLPSEGRPGQGY